jgi:DNA-binding response OmpR family regulator
MRRILLVEDAKDIQQNEDLALRKGDLKLSLSSLKAFLVIKNEEVDLNLTLTEFKILLCLMKSTAMVLNRDQIINAARGENVHVIDRTIDTHICAIRKKLGPKAHYIQSISGVGYRFSLKKS